jgi:hypothetical protein
VIKLKGKPIPKGPPWAWRDWLVGNGRCAYAKKESRPRSVAIAGIFCSTKCPFKHGRIDFNHNLVRCGEPEFLKGVVNDQTN